MQIRLDAYTSYPGCWEQLRRNRASFFLDFPFLCSHHATESLPQWGCPLCSSNGDKQHLPTTMLGGPRRRRIQTVIGSGDGWRLFSSRRTPCALSHSTRQPRPLLSYLASQFSAATTTIPGHIEKTIGRALVKGIGAAAWTTDATANLSLSTTPNTWMPCNDG